MRKFCIQLQPDRSPRLDLEKAVVELTALAKHASVSKGEDRVQYVNVILSAIDAIGLWAAIRKRLQANEELAKASTVICQGERGWDDYLLLHHFNPNVPLDELTDGPKSGS
jgi:hypothetical protein